MAGRLPFARWDLSFADPAEDLAARARGLEVRDAHTKADIEKDACHWKGRKRKN